MSVYYVCVPLNAKEQVSGPLDLELQAVVRHSVGAGDPT